MSSRARVTVMAEALRAVHFQLQHLYGLLKENRGLERVFLGRGRGGGEYTVLEVRG